MRGVSIKIKIGALILAGALFLSGTFIIIYERSHAVYSKSYENIKASFIITDSIE